MLRVFPHEIARFNPCFAISMDNNSERAPVEARFISISMVQRMASQVLKCRPTSENIATNLEIILCDGPSLSRPKTGLRRQKRSFEREEVQSSEPA